MKIVKYGNFSTGYMNDWDYYHVRDELKTHECEWIYFNLKDYESIESGNEAFLKYCKSEHPTLLLTASNEKELFLDTLCEVRKLGIPTVLSTGDNLFIAYDYKKCCKHFDLMWVAVHGNEEMFGKWGAHVTYMPSAANPNFCKPQYPFEEVSRVGFIGNPHSGRGYVINSLINADVPVSVHCKRNIASDESLAVPQKSSKEILKGEIKQASQWIKYPIGRKLLASALLKRVKAKPLNEEAKSLSMEFQVPFSEYSFSLQKYALALNFSEALSTGFLRKPVAMLPLRCFEIPMAGGIQFVRRTEELEWYFDDEKEIIYFDDYGDMVEKAKFWLRDSQKEARDKIRIAARKRAENEHTWWHRYCKLFDLLGIYYK